MGNFREVHDQRIRQLAETLKRNGLAASETEAINMAKNMTQTEDRVNSNFDGKKDAVTKGSMPAHTIREEEPAPKEQSSREEEVAVQEETPAPTHSNNALNEAITNVQEAYKPQTVDLGVEHAQDAPLQEVVEPAPEPVAEPAAQETYSEPEAQETHTEPVAEPTPTYETPQPTAEPVAQETYSEPVEEPQEFSQPTHDEPAPLEPEPTYETPEPVAEPVQEPVAEPAPEPVAEQAPEPEQPEHTKEVYEKAPKRDLSTYAESKVDLADVFGSK